MMTYDRKWFDEQERYTQQVLSQRSALKYKVVKLATNCNKLATNALNWSYDRIEKTYNISFLMRP